MPLGEFELIQRFFCWRSPESDVPVGIGDDAAVATIPGGKQLVVTTDTLISGVHFPQDTSAFDIGYKSLAVSLSDLAAMGAQPRWFTLALTLPEPDEMLLTGLSLGLKSLADKFGVALIGGDTTRGTLAITIQALGWVDAGRAVLRMNAQAGDDLYVTGTLGDAALGLECALGTAEMTLSPQSRERCLGRLNRPEPRVHAGVSLAPFLSAMIDCSDGFIADLEHILASSKCGAEVQLAALPVSSALLAEPGQRHWHHPLSGGDDYELIFSAAPHARAEINGIADNLDVSITRVGRMTQGEGLKLFLPDGQLFQSSTTGYTHF